jgi:hypothetical protein
MHIQQRFPFGLGFMALLRDGAERLKDRNEKGIRMQSVIFVINRHETWIKRPTSALALGRRGPVLWPRPGAAAALRNGRV